MDLGACREHGAPVQLAGSSCIIWVASVQCYAEREKERERERKRERKREREIEDYIIT